MRVAHTNQAQVTNAHGLTSLECMMGLIQQAALPCSPPLLQGLQDLYVAG